MNKTLLSLTSAAVALGTAAPAMAQYAPPPPTQPFPGFLNDYLRKQDPYYANWDLGGALRLRYELKENGLGLPPANDFRKTGVDNDNSYFSSKLLMRVGYTAKWWNFLVEGRDSSTTGDDRATIGGTSGNFESDGLDLQQAYGGADLIRRLLRLGAVCWSGDS